METKSDLFQDLKPEDRFKALQEMAHSTKKEKVRHYFTDDEKVQQKDFIAAESVKKMDVEKEFSGIKKEFNKTLKEYGDQIKSALVDVKMGYSENEETVVEIDDQSTGMMDVYDVKGRFLYSRKLHPEEMQTRIVSLPKTGTHG